MNLERKIRLLGRSINVIYYLIYFMVVVAAIIFFFMSNMKMEIKSLDPTSGLATNLQTIYILFLLISVPSALYFFHQNTIKLRNEKDQYEQFRKYKKIAYIRLWIVGFAFILGVFLAILMQSVSMLFAAAIAAIALYFCKPTRAKIINDLDLDVGADNRPPGTKYI